MESTYRISATALQRISEIASAAAAKSEHHVRLELLRRAYTESGASALSSRDPRSDEPFLVKMRDVVSDVCESELRLFCARVRSEDPVGRIRSEILHALWDLFWNEFGCRSTLQRHLASTPPRSRSLISDELLASLSAPDDHKTDRPLQARRRTSPKVTMPTIASTPAGNAWEAIILLNIPDDAFPKSSEGCFGQIFN